MKYKMYKKHKLIKSWCCPSAGETRFHDTRAPTGRRGKEPEDIVFSSLNDIENGMDALHWSVSYRKSYESTKCSLRVIKL